MNGNTVTDQFIDFQLEKLVAILLMFLTLGISVAFGLSVLTGWSLGT